MISVIFCLSWVGSFFKPTGFPRVFHLGDTVTGELLRCNRPRGDLAFIISHTHLCSHAPLFHSPFLLKSAAFCLACSALGRSETPRAIDRTVQPVGIAKGGQVNVNANSGCLLNHNPSHRHIAVFGHV